MRNSGRRSLPGRAGSGGTYAAIAAAVILTIAGHSPLLAAENFVATLIPQPGTGSTASGSATLVLADDLSTASFNITVTGLSSAEVAAHIHRADGSIAYTLPLGSPKIGVWNNPGLVDGTAMQLEQLYILVHTANNPTGEVRGNIVKQAVPVETGTWGAVKALFRAE